MQRWLSESDRRLATAIAVMVVLGAALLVGGAWAALHLDELRGRKGLLGLGIFLGPVLIGFAVAELRHRLRHGPSRRAGTPQASTTPLADTHGFAPRFCGW